MDVLGVPIYQLVQANNKRRLEQLDDVDIVDATEQKGGVLMWNAGLSRWISNSAVTDSSGQLSVDWYNRQLKDSLGRQGVDWENRLLTGHGPENSVDWYNRKLYASDGTTVNADYSTASRAVLKMADTSAINNLADKTKQILFSLAGSTTGTALQLNTANTVDRSITFPDASGTLALDTLASASITIGGSVVQPIEFGFVKGVTFIDTGATGALTPTAVSGVTVDSMVLGEATSNTLATFHGITSVALNNIVACSGNMNFNNMALCTSLSAPNLRIVGGQFSHSTNNSVTTFSFPMLQSTALFQPNIFNALTSLSLPALTSVSVTFNPGNMAVATDLSFPVLATVTVNFTPNTMALLTNFSFPSLKIVGAAFGPNTMASLTTISLPALTTIGGNTTISTMAALTTVSLSAMADYIGTITMNSSLGNLTTLTLGTIGTLKSIGGATINIANQKLDAASVNGLLALLVSLDGTGGTTLWGAGKTLTINGGTNAAPSGGGVADKATLTGRGATVTTN